MSTSGTRYSIVGSNDEGDELNVSTGWITSGSPCTMRWSLSGIQNFPGGAVKWFETYYPYSQYNDGHFYGLTPTFTLSLS